MTTEPLAVAARQVEVGDTDVRFQGSDAVVISVASPNDPRSRVDLVYQDQGRRRIANSAPRGLAPGCWSFRGDAEAARERTPLELLAEAKARGERVPEVGLLVLYGRNRDDFRPGRSMVEIVPTRATIVAVHSLTLVDLDLHDPEPPVDPEAREPFRGRQRGVMAAAAASDHVRAMGFRECWSYPDEGLILPFGPVDRLDLFPPATCSRCRKGCRSVRVILPHPQDLEGRGDRPDLPAKGMLCPACIALVEAFLAPPPPGPVVA